MKLFCHLGMQKTGSTALQFWGSDNQATLKELGLDYPDKLSTGFSHLDLFSKFGESQDAELARLKTTGRELLLSCEEGYLAEQQTIDGIAAHASEIHILMFVRRPSDWVNSYLNQAIKSYNVRIRFLEQFDIRSDDLDRILNIEKALGRWKKTDKISSITAYRYEKHTDAIDTCLEWLESFGYDFSGKVFERRKANPNKALDEQSIRVFIELKRRLRGVNIESHVAHMRQAHIHMKRQWDDTRAKAGVQLLSAAEEHYLNKRYDPHIEGVLRDYSPNRKSMLEIAEPTDADIAVVERIMEKVTN